MLLSAQTKGVLLLCLIAGGVFVADYWRVSTSTGSRQLLKAQDRRSGGLPYLALYNSL